MHKRLSAALLVSLTIACGSDEPHLTVAVEGTSFARVALPAPGARMATIPFNVTNRGSATAFVTTCGPQISAVIERWTGTSWEQYAAGFCALDIIAEPLELRSLESRGALASIYESGRFRIRAHYALEPTTDPHAGLPSTPSRPFDVH